MTNLSFQAPFPQCHQASTAREPGFKPRSNDNIPVLVQSPFITLTRACTRETYAQNYTPSPGLFLSPRVRQTTVCFKLLPQSPPLTNSTHYLSQACSLTLILKDAVPDDQGRILGNIISITPATHTHTHTLSLSLSPLATTYCHLSLNTSSIHPFLKSLYCCSWCLVIQLYLTLVTPWTVARQLRCPWGFSSQENWSGLLFPSPTVVVRCLQISPRYPQLS